MTKPNRFDFNLRVGEDEHKGLIFDNGQVMKTINVAYLLNKLSEENEQLKKQIERIDFILDDLNGAEYISRDDGIKALNKIDKVIGKR